MVWILVCSLVMYMWCMHIAVNWVIVIMSFLWGSRQANVWVLMTGTIFNGMDCMCVDVYFHERREILDHASGFISSNILDRLDAIFGSKFEWIFLPSGQLQIRFTRAAGGIGGNPSGLFLVRSVWVDRFWIRGNCFSVPPQFFEKICVGALTPSSRSSFGDVIYE